MQLKPQQAPKEGPQPITSTGSVYIGAPRMPLRPWISNLIRHRHRDIVTQTCIQSHRHSHTETSIQHTDTDIGIKSHTPAQMYSHTHKHSHAETGSHTNIDTHI